MRIIFLWLFVGMVWVLPHTLIAQGNSAQNENDSIEKAIDLMFMKSYAESLELLFRTRESALRQKHYDEAFDAVLNIGNNYYSLSDYGEAFQNYSEAYEIAIAHLDPNHETVILNNIGILYMEEEETVKGRGSFYKAYKIAKSLDNQLQVGAYAVNLAMADNKMNQLDSAAYFIEEAFPLIQEDPALLLLCSIAKAENALMKGDFKESEEICLSILPDLQPVPKTDNRQFVHLILAKVYQAQDEIQKAIDYAKKARFDYKEIEQGMQAYELLSSLYSKDGNFGTALAYKDSVILATHRSHEVRNMKLFENEKVKFQLRSSQHELDKSKEIIQSERRFFYLIIGVVILLMGMVAWIYRSISFRQKQDNKIVELELEKEKTNNLLLEKQTREKAALTLLEHERLKNELEVKNRKLASKALYQASKNDLVDEILSSLLMQSEISENASLKQKINDLKTHLQKDTNWDQFFVHFEDVNQGFLDRLRLRHPILTSSDIRFIVYLYMNLSNKEIASLLNITYQSCRKRKERLARKMEVESATTLGAYLASV